MGTKRRNQPLKPNAKPLRQEQLKDPQIRRMERARDLLQRVVLDVRRGHVATPENVALMSSVIATIALLEHEIGRHTMALMDADVS